MHHVLLLEPFYGGSHKQLIDYLVEILQAKNVEVTKVTMSDKKWHWRLRTSALYFAEHIPKDKDFSCIFVSSVINLSELIGLRPDLFTAYKILYFHENQLIYPVQKQQDRDFQYGYNQIVSTLSADVVLFNSLYNMESFLVNLKSFLNLMPDYRPKLLQEKIRPKCAVLYFPLKLSILPMINKPSSGALHITWPHRWDKVEKSCSNWWFCLECEQWNGFKEDGDYYQHIPEMYETVGVSTNEANCQTGKSLLCQACLVKQSRKINELAAFVPKDEEHFELESDDFERFLNEKYKPCLSCLSVISYHLQEQDKQIHTNHTKIYSSSSSSLRKLNMNNTSDSSKFVLKSVVKLILLLASLWLYRLPTSISTKYVLVYPACFFIYFNILYKSRSFRFKGLVSLLGFFLYYSGRLKLIAIFVSFFYAIEVISTLFELFKWIFQIKVSSSQQQMSKVKKFQQNCKFDIQVEGIVTNDFNRVESFIDTPPHGSSIVTPDLLHGHLDAMQIGNKDSTSVFKGTMNERNHVMAALKYKDIVNHKKIDSSQRPLLRPATFVLQQKKDCSVPDRLMQDDEPFTKIKPNFVPKECISSRTVASNENSVSHKKFNWTYLAIGGLLISFLVNVYLISKFLVV